MDDLVKQDSQVYEELNMLRHQLALLRSKVDWQTQQEEKLRKTLQELRSCKESLNSHNKKLRNIREELERVNKKYIDIFDFTPIGFFAFDHNGIILEVNRTVTFMLGFNKKNLLGNQMEDFLSEESTEHFKSHLNNIFTKDMDETIEVEINCKDGKTLSFNLDKENLIDTFG